MDKNLQIAQEILEKVGGKGNVTNVVHCMTRLRFDLKDASIAKEEEIKKIDGVMGVVTSGGQFQVVIGQNVPKVYKEICKLGEFKEAAAIDENLDASTEGFSVKKVLTGVLSYLSGTMATLIPGFMAAALFKTLAVVLGPDMLKVITVESDLYVLFTFLYDAFFYFLPIMLGYSAAKKLNASPVLGMFLGAVIISPTFISMIGVKEAFTVFGINAPLNNYSSTILPMLIGVGVMAAVEKGVRKIMPDMLSTVFTPFLTILVMTPLMFCAIAPIGGWLGTALSSGLIALATKGGFVGVAVIAALWEFLVMTGMHQAVIMFAIINLFSGNPDTCILLAGNIATFATYGVALGAAIKIKEKKDKSLALGYFVSGFFGGIAEPTLYGICMRYKKPFIALAGSAFVGGALAKILGVSVHLLGATNFLTVLGFVQGGSSNMISGCIAMVVTFVLAVVLTIVLGGFDNEEK